MATRKKSSVLCCRGTINRARGESRERLLLERGATLPHLPVANPALPSLEKSQLTPARQFLYIMFVTEMDRHQPTDTAPPVAQKFILHGGEMGTRGHHPHRSIRCTPCSSFRRTHCRGPPFLQLLPWPAPTSATSPRSAGLGHRHPGQRHRRTARDHFQTTKTSGNLPHRSEERQAPRVDPTLRVSQSAFRTQSHSLRRTAFTGGMRKHA